MNSILPNTPAANDDLIATDKSSVWHHLTPHQQWDHKDPIIIQKGVGMRVTDTLGKSYLDATSGGVWCVNVGFGRERIANAVRDQLLDLCYFAGSYGTEPAARFAQQLLTKMPGLSRVYYSSSGSEANEKGYKMVRQLAHINGDGSKHKIIYRDRDYHGTTIGALSSTGHEQRTAHYGPFAPGFSSFAHCLCYRCPFGKTYGSCNIECARDLETAILREGPDSVGAVVLEPITAGGGVIPPPPEYFPIIQEICTRYGVLIHIDEVVCGLGRTGTWFGYQHYDVKPDIVTMAKGVASGYAAISCTVTTESLFNEFRRTDRNSIDYFRDISTFGGCTSGPVAGIETMAILEEENLIENTRLMGDYLMDKLHELKDKHRVVGDVRGKGLFVGIELVQDRATKEPVSEQDTGRVAAHCLEHGVMIGRTNRSFADLNNTLYLSPALIATKTDLDAIVRAIDDALSSIFHSQ
jgi:taurine-pyruvate aminotransferase